MSDFFTEDFFAPLDPEFVHPERPTLKQLQEPQAPTPKGVRAPAQVLFEVQNELWTLIGDLEREHVLKGKDREEFMDDLERTYRKLQRYLRSRTPEAQ